MTKEVDNKTPMDRLNYSGSLEPVVDRLGKAYGIGRATEFSVIGVGYEDCNVIVSTDNGKFLAKIFSKVRTEPDIARYATIMERVVEAGVNHPPLLKNSNGNVVHKDPEANNLSLVLMKYIEGETFLELDRAPDDHERQAVIEQAAKVNKIDFHPSYLPDSWAIPNIQAMYDRTKQFVEAGDLTMVEEVIRRYKDIPVETLPNCFVHGDFTKSNVLKTPSGDIYILDFSVANWYPRIQELAVISANLLHDGGSSLQGRTTQVAREYEKFNQLTDAERKFLFDYALAGVAMEFMGSYQEKFINGNDTEETDYWMTLGREGLRKELS